MDWFSGLVTAGATVAIAYFAYQQTNFAEQQSIFAEQQSNFAEQQSNFALQQAKATEGALTSARAASRAYVFGGPGARNGREGNYTGIRITYANYGQSPAVIVSVSWSQFVEGEGGHSIAGNCGDGVYMYQNTRESVLFPAVGTKSTEAPELDTPVRGYDDVISCGQIVYCDVFKIKHYSRWGHRIKAPNWDVDETLPGAYTDSGDLGAC